MAVVVGEIQPGTLAGDDHILERLLFVAITQTEGVEIGPQVCALRVRTSCTADAPNCEDASHIAILGLIR